MLKNFVNFVETSVQKSITLTPPGNAPQGRKNREGGEETGQGERDEQGEMTGQGRPRSSKTVQSAEGGEGKEKRERIIVVVTSPCQERDPADAHPSVHKSVLESANPRMDSECASGSRLFLVAWIPSPRGGGGCLPAFFEILGALSGINPPPPRVGVGQEWVGIFWGKYL